MLVIPYTNKAILRKQLNSHSHPGGHYIDTADSALAKINLVLTMQIQQFLQQFPHSWMWAEVSFASLNLHKTWD